MKTKKEKKKRKCKIRIIFYNKETIFIIWNRAIDVKTSVFQLIYLSVCIFYEENLCTALLIAIILTIKSRNSMRIFCFVLFFWLKKKKKMPHSHWQQHSFDRRSRHTLPNARSIWNESRQLYWTKSINNVTTYCLYMDMTILPQNKLW